MQLKNTNKPNQINIAANLFWASLAIGFAKALMDIQHIESQATPAFTNVILITVFGLMALLIFYISKGKNWARITFLVLFVIGSLPSVPIVLGEFTRSPILGAFSAIQIILQLVALYFIFTKPGSDWFKKAI